MKKRIIFITGLFFLCLQLFSQGNDFRVTGTVLDRSSKKAIEFATVQLLNSRDSAVMKTTVTDQKGKFILDKIQAGHYIFSCSFIT